MMSAWATQGESAAVSMNAKTEILELIFRQAGEWFGVAAHWLGDNAVAAGIAARNVAYAITHGNAAELLVLISVLVGVGMAAYLFTRYRHAVSAGFQDGYDARNDKTASVEHQSPVARPRAEAVGVVTSSAALNDHQGSANDTDGAANTDAGAGSPASGDTLQELGMAAYRAGDYATAVHLLEPASVAGDLDALVHRCFALYNTGKASWAVSTLEHRQRSAHPAEMGKLSYALGLIHFELGEFPMAAEHFAHAAASGMQAADRMLAEIQHLLG